MAPRRRQRLIPVGPATMWVGAVARVTPALGELNLGQRGGWKHIGRPCVGDGGGQWGAIDARPDKRSLGEFDGSQGFSTLE
jgi:hypothetical protein